MTWRIYHFTDSRGDSILKEWVEEIRLPMRQRGQLDRKIDSLAQNGPCLPPQLLAGTRSRHIRKLKIKSNIQLRPMLCAGPLNMDEEFTLLLGAVERDYKLDPLDAPERAEANRQTLLSDHSRRIEHESFG